MSSLYLHIPFCQSKCPYCDFFSQVPEPGELDEYVALLQLQLQLFAAGSLSPPEFESIFFGGGTPSLLTPGQLHTLLNQVANQFTLSSDVEITLEINPGTVDLGTLQNYRSAGANRLSIGVQSLCPANLHFLQRIHTAEQARQAVGMARQAGFDNLSVDLMFGLPGQTQDSLTLELEDLLSLETDHLSLYGLSVEPGTVFEQRAGRGETMATSEGLFAEMYRLLHDRLSGHGFHHYEISNFARPGFECRHNLGYWRRQPCYAAGAGGHSLLPRGWGERWQNPADLEEYGKVLRAGQDPLVLLETFDQQGAMAETVYLALRTSEGLCCKAFRETFGRSPEEVFPAPLRELQNVLAVSEDRWMMNFEGWLIYDHLISKFL